MTDARWTPQTQVVPATGQKLPSLGLGCAGLGNLFAPVAEPEADAALEAAWTGGVSYFDTAPFYGHGLSEHRLGRFLRAAPRPGVMISSKVGRSLRPAGDGPRADTGNVDAAPFEPYFDYGYDAVMRQIEASLERLGLDHLDLVFVHDIGALTHGADHPTRLAEALGGAFPALRSRREQGVVGAVGIGVNEAAVCLEVLEREDLDIILLAGRYTLLDQSAGKTLLRPCEARGVGVIVGGPYNSGVLAGGRHYDYADAPATVTTRADRLRAVCEAHGVALLAAALHFPLRHPAVISVIPGARSPAEVTANIGHFQSPPPENLWADLCAQGLLDDSPP